MKFFFHLLPFKTPQHSSYPHQAVQLAEGFRALGYEYSADAPAYFDPKLGDYLLKKTFEPEEADVHIYEIPFITTHGIEVLDKSKFNALFDPYIGMVNPGKLDIYQHFPVVFKNHYVIRYENQADNLHPWNFGLTNRMIEYTDKYADNVPESIVINTYRVRHNLRELAIPRFDAGIEKAYPVKSFVTEQLEGRNSIDLPEAERIYWEQSGRRHNPAYYEALSKALLIYAFGGFLYALPYGANPKDQNKARWNNLMGKIYKMLGKDFSQFMYIVQFESWRIWESFYSKGCPITMHFEDWGFQPAVMPQHKVHYFGVKGLKFRESAEELAAMPEAEIRKMGLEGRKWVKEHYAPVPVTQRFLKIVNEHI